ncbi:MAG TPA: PTS sugar transporter subunit IIA [Planctomycetota bacterium]|nr:PTS sugar transporter subunit IIA [Planctomycetota bacterium]
MKLSDLLRENQIVLGFQARDKEETIVRLVDALVAGARLPRERRDAALDALRARERLASTGLENGIAFPHAAVDGLREPAAALAVAPRGVPFESVDGRPARLIVLLTIPRPSTRTHLRALAAAAKLLSLEAFRAALLDARTPGEALQAVRAHEG